MTEKTTPAKADDKKAAAANKSADDTRNAGSAQDGTDSGANVRSDSRQPPTGDGDVAAPVDETPVRSDGAPARPEGLDPGVAPYPQYEDEDVDALRSHAKGRGVEINQDVEKALLIQALRDKDRAAVDRVGPDQDEPGSDRYASYDVMPLDELRSLATSRDVGLDPVDEKSHLVTELRAADSGAYARASKTL